MVCQVTIKLSLYSEKSQKDKNYKMRQNFLIFIRGILGTREKIQIQNFKIGTAGKMIIRPELPGNPGNPGNPGPGLT